MSCERLIRKYGVPLTIQRTPTTTIYGNIKGSTSNNVEDRYNFSELIGTLCTPLLTDGEVIYDSYGLRYFLAVDIIQGMKNGVTQYVKALLLRCNSTVTIQKLVNGVLTTVTANVHCLITKSRFRLPEDESMYRERAGGIQQMNFIYMAASAGLLPIHYINDGTRSLKVLDNISPYTAGGIIEAQAVLEA